MSESIRVVIIDDSSVARNMLVSMISRDPAIRVVGQARDGEEGIRIVQSLRPDVVTMDVTMPGLDGIATTEHLMAYCPTPILVLTGSLNQNDVDVTFRMLDAGALEVIEKPSGIDLPQFERATRELIRRIKVLARVRVVTHLRGRRRGGETPAPTAVPPVVVTKPVEEAPLKPLPQPVVYNRRNWPLIMIGASTGGPRVVHRILSELPSDLHAAIVVVQHIAEGFGHGMAEWLQNGSRLPVRLATEDMPIMPGHVLIAPDQRDILVTVQGRVHLTQSPLLLQRPSIDVAMQAAAEVYAARTIGVLLTGMGRDGAYGMLTIRKRGGYTIAQDEQSSTIFGMPKAAIQINAACEVLSPSQIVNRLIEITRQPLAETSAINQRGAS